MKPISTLAMMLHLLTAEAVLADADAMFDSSDSAARRLPGRHNRL